MVENKELQIFKNPEFGAVRTLEIGTKIYFVGSDVAKALGYARPADAITAHCKGSVKRRLLTNGGMQEMKVIPEGDLYRLVVHSELPAAEKFESWVFDEVLPAIRKTGSYSVKKSKDEEAQMKRLEIMERNAKSRQAKILLQIAERTKIPEYKEVCNAKAAEMVTGQEILPLPEAERRTYSATEIGKMFGVSANKIGKLANQHKLKTPVYGKLFYSKSEHSVKEVETWRYYESAVPAFEKIFGREAVVA